MSSINAVNALSNISGGESEFGDQSGNHTIKTAPENVSDVGAMRQPTDPEVFRFLDLPLEIQNKIYGNLLIYHEPVVLKFRHPVEPERRGVRWGSYETRLGMFPQICRLSWKFAWDSLAVLYGENTFHFTLSSDIFRLKYSLGLNTCSHFIKRVVMDIFTSEISDSLGTCTDLRRQSNFWKNERLDMQSKVWVRIHVPVGVFPNVKKLYLNLPKNLEVLTKNNEDLVLEMKRDVPKHAVVEFTGAMPDIVSKLTAAWFNHDAEKLDELPKDLQPFKPLQWYKQQEKELKR